MHSLHIHKDDSFGFLLLKLSVKIRDNLIMSNIHGLVNVITRRIIINEEHFEKVISVFKQIIELL